MAPATAQTVGESFCKTPLVKTGRNILTVIQFGGPVLGSILAAGATVVLPASRRADVKRELKAVRRQAVVWGIVVAPLSITIVEFLLTTIVAGGKACGL